MIHAALYGAVALAGWGIHRDAESSDDGSARDATSDPSDLNVNQQGTTRFTAAQIVMPVMAYNGIAPDRSQEYRADDHHGCDIMFPRNGRDDLNYPNGTPNGARNYFMPDGQWAVAAAPGSIWSTGVGPTGIYVVLDHGKPFATFYVHFDALDPQIPMGIQGGAGKIQVAAGQRLGRIGFSPRDAAKLKHLHFEVWRGGAAESHTDPWPFIQHATVLSAPHSAAPTKLVAHSLTTLQLGDEIA